MKSIYCLLFVLIQIQILYGQENVLGIPTTDEGSVEYSEVIPVEGASASELKTRCEKWFAKTYKDAQEVIQNKTEDNIIGKGAFSFIYIEKLYTSPVNGTYTISVDFKDGKYRYTINNIYLGIGANQGAMRNLIDGYKVNAKDQKKMGRKMAETQKQMLEKANNEIQSVISSLKKGMAVAKDDDW